MIMDTKVLYSQLETAMWLRKYSRHDLKILELILHNFENRTYQQLQIGLPVVTITSKTATKMAVPSYQPVLTPWAWQIFSEVIGL